MKKAIKWLLSALYGLVMIEVLIMISPFAFYWYGFYTPALQGLHRWKATAWTESFFLPHSVITTSAVLEFVRWKIGPYCFSLGLIFFLLCAIQIYGAKLFKRGIVGSGIYRWIRHPQYLSLAVAGFGLLTIWPRIIILVLYLGMLIAYYFLARFEEQREEKLHPEYADYRRRTAMFIPGNPGGRLFGVLFGWIPDPGFARALSTVIVIAIVLGGALFLRSYTIAHSATAVIAQERMLAVCVWPMDAQKIRQVVDVALHDSRVRAALEKEHEVAFTAHLLPANYGMVNMFADIGKDHRQFAQISLHRFDTMFGIIFPFVGPDQKPRIMGSPQDSYKVVFSRVDKLDHPILGVSHVTDLSAKMTPVIIAQVGSNAPSHDPGVKSVIIPPRRSFWGSIVMPMF